VNGRRTLHHLVRTALISDGDNQHQTGQKLLLLTEHHLWGGTRWSDRSGFLLLDAAGIWFTEEKLSDNQQKNRARKAPSDCQELVSDTRLLSDCFKKLESSFTPDGSVMKRHYSQLLPTLQQSADLPAAEEKPHFKRWKRKRSRHIILQRPNYTQTLRGGRMQRQLLGEIATAGATWSLEFHSQTLLSRKEAWC